MTAEIPKQSMHCVDCGKTHPPRAALAPSPFHSIVSQEGIPASSEAAAIRDFAREIDAEITKREHTIDRLLCEVEELRRRSEQHKAFIAPIRRVPPEIIAKIFLQLTAVTSIEASAARSSYPDQHFSEAANFFEKAQMIRPVLHQAPLIFGEVSRHWRAIALSTPQLWNSIFLECLDTDNISSCETWLKRSGSLPLSIRFYRSGSPVTHKVADQCHDLFATILPYAARWRLLEFQNIPAVSYDVFRRHLPDSLPILEVLSVDRSPLNNWAGLRTAPRLRLLHFDAMGYTLGDFPWSQLTHIDMGACSSYDCLYILNEAPTAFACRFFVTQSSSVQHPLVSHSAMRTLKIHTAVYLGPFWSCLTCPQLSALTIESLRESSSVSLSDLTSFITRSGATIENFTFKKSRFSDAAFMAVLADMPRLRHLDLSLEDGETQFLDQVWESLTWKRNSSPLIPDLESLCLVGGEGCSDKAVVRMLKSRVRTAASPAEFVPKLKAVKLDIWRHMSASACRRLRAFTQFGLNITLTADPEGVELDEGDEKDEEDDSEGGDSDDGEDKVRDEDAQR